MDNKILEIFIPGPAGRLEAKYYKSKKNTSPIALVLQPHPQYGGPMNNKVVVDTFQTFIDNDFSVCRVNFRGVGKSDGEFDNGQGELADAAAASANSPCPLSKSPSLFPTPLKFTLHTEKLFSTNVLNVSTTTLLFIVPPYCGCGCNTKAIGEVFFLLL